MNWSKELVLVDFIPLNLISLLPCALKFTSNILVMKVATNYRLCKNPKICLENVVRLFI